MRLGHIQMHCGQVIFYLILACKGWSDFSEDILIQLQWIQNNHWGTMMIRMKTLSTYLSYIEDLLHFIRPLAIDESTSFRASVF